jgi:hypothetical protein
MNPHVVRKILDVYDQYCRRTGRPVTLPQPFHRCVEGCIMVEIPRTNPPMFVCEWSRNIHECGKNCTRGEALRDNSGIVCPLTGVVLPIQIFKHHVGYLKEGSKRRSNDHHVKMATGQSKKRRRSSSIIESKDKLLSTIQSTLKVILMSKKREEMYLEAKARFHRDIRTKFRSQFSKGPIYFTKALGLVQDIRHRFGRSLNRPTDNIDDTTLHAIAKLIADYFIKVQKASRTINDTVNSVEVFTACIINKLATGLTINDVVIIQKHVFFQRHAPDEIQFGQLPNIGCRAMTVCNRSLRGACITDGGFTRAEFIFRL